MANSTHKCEVVRVKEVKPHPNADRLDIIEIFGYSVCVQKNGFKVDDLGIYIPPDSIVPETDEFKWVWEAKGYVPLPNNPVPEKYRRIKAKVLRGVVSEGILLPLEKELFIKSSPNQLKVGDDIAELLGITHYEPPVSSSLGGDCEAGPDKGPTKKKRGYPKTLRGWYNMIRYWLFPKDPIHDHEEMNQGLQVPVYDVDAWQRYGKYLKEGEEVWITEKIHGANFRAVFVSDANIPNDCLGRMYVGSHRQWKKNIEGSVWWTALRQNPWIEEFCRMYPNRVLYGELVPTQKLNYGQKKGEYRVFGFDVYDAVDRKYWDYNTLFDADLCDTEKWVPTIIRVKYNEATIRQYSTGYTRVSGATHIREGIVIKPLTERVESRFGRVILKIVSPEYLSSKQSDEL